MNDTGRATLRSTDLLLVANKRMAAARDVLDGMLQGHLAAEPRTVDEVVRLLGRAAVEVRMARDIEALG